MPKFVVLVNVAGDELKWSRLRVGDPPDDPEATTIAVAIGLVRDAHPELKGNRDARYYATSKFDTKRMRRKLIESWELGPADEPDDEPQQGTLA